MLKTIACVVAILLIGSIIIEGTVEYSMLLLNISIIIYLIVLVFHRFINTCDIPDLKHMEDYEYSYLDVVIKEIELENF